jgi:ribosomal protein S18 acetylase RimI-like enzyme
MGDPEVVVREYQASDRATVVALAPRLLHGMAPWRDGGAARRAVEGWLSESCSAAAHGDGRVFVAAQNGVVVGAVSVTPSRHFTGDVDAYVGELVVSECAARQGIARALMTRVEQWAREQGLRRITLHTGAANDVARAFYAALGFEDEDVRLTRRLEESTTPVVVHA